MVVNCVEIKIKDMSLDEKVSYSEKSLGFKVEDLDLSFFFIVEWL